MAATALPYTQLVRDGVMYLTLSTPDCDVNIFNNRAAEQLTDILGTLDTDTRAVVFASGKPDSYINGVGLLMAIAVKSPDGGGALTATVRGAYHAVRDCRVPTVAAIAGNCYGCGVEFSLFCDYRVAADTASTHFYMTEVNDYLFLPIFEGTQRLPLLLGLESAADLLLWEKRWTARQALDGGLINAVFAAETMVSDTHAFVLELLGCDGAPARCKAPVRRRDEHAPSEERLHIQRQRLAALPPAFQPVYADGLDLMVRAVTAGRVSEKNAALEIERSSASSCQQVAKSALSFFMIRQATHQRCLGGVPEPRGDVVLRVADDGPALRAWHATLAERKLPGVRLLALGASASLSATLAADADTGAGADVGTWAMHFVDGARPAEEALSPRPAHAIGVLLPGSAAPLTWPASSVLTSPFSHDWPLLELAVQGEIASEHRRAYRLLTRMGWRVVISRPKEHPVVLQALIAWYAPLVRYVLAGGGAGLVDGTLREFGVVRRPRRMLRSIALGPLAASLARALGSSLEPVQQALAALAEPGETSEQSDDLLRVALCVSLLAAAERWRTEKILSHAGLVDLVARDGLDFPLHHGSLLTYLTRARIQGLAQHRSALVALASSADLATLDAAAAGQSEVYL